MKRIPIILTYSFLLLLLFVNFYRVAQLKDNRKVTKELFERINFMDERIKIYEQYILIQLKAEGMPLDLRKITSENDDDLSRLMTLKNGGQNILVVRFSKLSCQTCMDIQLEVLKNKLSKKVLENNVIFLSRYNSPKDIDQFKRIHQIDATIYNLDENVTPIDSLNIPYFFCLTPEGTINKVFIPGEFNLQFTEKYLEDVQNILCISKN